MESVLSLIAPRPTAPIDFFERGIGEAQATDLRHRLSAFAEDWDRPEMAAYDELPTG